IGNQLTAKPREVKYAAVIGGGTMGAGIAHGLLRAGVLVRLIEVNPQAAGAGVGRVKRMLEEDVAAGRITRLQAKHALHHLSPTTEWTGLRLADLVVEAVIERMDAKREVFAKLDRLTRSDAVLATNTSSLSVTEMAAATEHRGRVVGLHFFNPVPKMALVEVVRTADSDDVSLATAAAIALRMGKTPVLVKDAPGFVVNRILIPYLLEALAMATEDAPIREVDVAMKQWGMPMGPFELLDEIGLDTGWHVLRSLGGMLDQQVQTPAAVEQAVGRGWLGKKSGRGFYLYDDKKKAGDVNEEFVAMLRTCQGEFSAEAAQWRLVLPMVNAAAMLLEAGVVDSADTIDLATVLGTGFAPFRGGVMHFADSVGAEEIVARLHELAKRHGPRFAPAPLLLRAAAMKSSVSHLAPVAPATSSPARDASASKPTHA
ncbi:MAG TPA: 3-hydroxyacyl-CoA dehydrogenase NAD-binding domain-containing protein, partial [Tepidisphaeraceae bacterium]